MLLTSIGKIGMNGPNLSAFIKACFKTLGLEIRRAHHDPWTTFLGLRSRRFDTIIDVGANEGQFARRILRFYPGASVHCFEPHPEAFAALSRWAVKSHKKVTVHNVALGEDEGQVFLSVHLDHSPSSSVLAATELNASLYPKTKRRSTVQVQQRTLDQTFRGCALGELLIKLDVQGYEDRVIRGGRETIMRSTACLLEVNLDSLYDGQASFEALVVLLGELGLRYAGNLEQAHGLDGHVVFFDALFLKPQS